MQLEVGMYVRTDKGIKKITTYEFDNFLKRHYVNCDKTHWGFSFGENEIKASHNIIDLIEQMDLMFIDISPDDCGGIVVPRIAETLNELEEWKKHISNGNWILKGIVTKEQIESARYKVGE